MKRVNQFERTDRASNALLTVMESKSLEKISVQEHSGRGDGQPSTFHQHFRQIRHSGALQEKYIAGLTESNRKVTGRASESGEDHATLCGIWH